MMIVSVLDILGHRIDVGDAVFFPENYEYRHGIVTAIGCTCAYVLCDGKETATTPVLLIKDIRERK